MSNMIIHLITDFGMDAPDHTISQAHLVRNFPDAKLIFSPQNFKKGHVLQQAIFGKLVSGHFPDQTIHIFRVGMLSKTTPRFVLGHYANQFFLSPDNGILPLLFDDPHQENAKYYQITPAERVIHPLMQVYIPAIQKLIQSQWTPESNFEIKSQLVRSTMPEPTIAGNQMRLTVIYNDVFGNAYFNLNYRDFELIRQNRRFTIRVNHFTEIQKLSLEYNDVDEGDAICTFNYGGIMQISVNSGSSAQLLALTEGRNVILEFKDTVAST